MKCNAPITGHGRDNEPIRFCSNEAKWYHASGCDSKYRCTKHTYKDATGRACVCCGNHVERIK